MKDRSHTVETCVKEMRKKLVEGGEYVFTRGWQHDPFSFRNIGSACEQLFKAFPSLRTVLTMRHANLRILREMCLERGINVVVPEKNGADVYRIPQSALLNPDGSRKHDSLSLTRALKYAELYTGPVNLVVTGCLGFNPPERRLYLLDDDGCAGLIEEWQTRWMESMAGEQVYGFALPHDVPVVAVASDLQKVEGWPGVMQSYLEADFVVTPTRIIDLEIPQISTFNFVT